MESDLDYLVSRLGKIDGFGDAGDYLLNIVKSKRSEQADAKAKSEEKPAEKPDEKGSDNKDVSSNLQAYVDAQKR
jgi:vacuolar protein sorting-associated protein 54